MSKTRFTFELSELSGNEEERVGLVRAMLDKAGLSSVWFTAEAATRDASGSRDRHGGERAPARGFSHRSAPDRPVLDRRRDRVAMADVIGRPLVTVDNVT